MPCDKPPREWWSEGRKGGRSAEENLRVEPYSIPTFTRGQPADCWEWFTLSISPWGPPHALSSSLTGYMSSYGEFSLVNCKLSENANKHLTNLQLQSQCSDSAG